MPPDSPTSQISRRKLRIAGIVLGLVAAAVAVAGIATRAADKSKLNERAESQSIPTVAVVAPGNSGDAGALELPGRLEANSRASIFARVSGYLKSWKADIGTPVKAGQLLAEIETPDLDQQLLQAKANLASAQANASLAETTARRWQSMLGSDSVSRQEAEEKAGDYATKKALVNAAQAEVDRVTAMKGFTRIVAPFDGVVTARNTDVGALINAGGGSGPQLFEVSDTRKLRVYVSVPQSYASIVKVGAKAKLTVPEQPGKSYAATVESSSRAVNVASGTMLIQLAVDNAAAELLPGGFANVSLEMPKGAGALNIPPSALIFGKSGLRVATVGPNDKVLIKQVTISRDLGRVVELASGITAADRVIDSPPDGIAEGDVVRVAKNDAKNDAKK